MKFLKNNLSAMEVVGKKAKYIAQEKHTVSKKANCTDPDFSHAADTERSTAFELVFHT